MNLQDKKWLFLDVGNIILNDDPGVAFAYKCYHDEVVKNGFDITFDDFLHERDQIFAERGHLYNDLVAKYLSDSHIKKIRKRSYKEGQTRWGELNPLIPQSKQFIRKASEKYKLGIIANQPAVCEDVLRDHGLLEYFDFVGLSESVGLNKPDIDFFKFVIKEAGAHPNEAIMIGDRVDNDIAPAKQLGMGTIHLKLNVYEKVNGLEISEELKTYLPHVHQFNISFREPVSEAQNPHYAVNSFAELNKLLFNE